MTGKQLKNSILQWAIQGKLVPQDPNDEPASVLLEKIRAEKARLVKEGKIKKDKKKSIIYRGEDNSYYEKFTDGKVVCIDDEIPFEIPNGWEWCRLGEIVSFVGGYAYKSHDFIEDSSYQVLRLGNVKNDYLKLNASPVFIPEDIALITEKYKCLPCDILITMTGTRKKRDYFFTYKVSENDCNLFINQRVGALRPYESLVSDYLRFSLKSETILQDVFQYETGTANQGNLGAENILKILIPLPPLAEQYRIVAKIEKLMPFVEVYDKAQTELDTLNAKLPEALKKSILQEAIQGKLVPQNPNNEPASVLLQRIKEEKLRLVKEGKLKKKDVIDSTIFRGDDNKYYEQIGKHCIDITDCIPFDLPANWSWCRIENYVKLVTDFVASGSFASLRENVKYYKTPNYAILVKAQDFQYDFQKDLTYTDKHGYDFLSGSNLFGGELILSNVGSIGKVFIVPKLDVRMSLAPNSIMVKPIYENQIKWLYNLFNSEFGVQLLYSISSATAIRKFNKTSFKKLIIPIPPIEEQERIVKKIETVFNRIKG